MASALLTSIVMGALLAGTPHIGQGAEKQPKCILTTIADKHSKLRKDKAEKARSLSLYAVIPTQLPSISTHEVVEKEEGMCQFVQAQVNVENNVYEILVSNYLHGKDILIITFFDRNRNKSVAFHDAGLDGNLNVVRIGELLHAGTDKVEYEEKMYFMKDIPKYFQKEYEALVEKLLHFYKGP